MPGVIHRKDAKDAKKSVIKAYLDKSSPRQRGSGNPLILKPLDDSLRSPFGLPSGRSMRYAPLSRFRGNDRLVQTFLKEKLLTSFAFFAPLR
jgi:hypothetical protein